MKCVGELLVIDLKGYNDGVNVFPEEFWGRIQREDGWKAPPNQWGFARQERLSFQITYSRVEGA